MSTTTVPRKKPSVKRPVETTRQTRERWLKVNQEAVMDPEVDEATRDFCLRRIGELLQELSRLP